MAAKSCKSTLASVLVAIVAIVVSNVLSTLRPFKEQPPTADTSYCTLLGGEEPQRPWGAEDMVLTRAIGGWVISSSVDADQLESRGIDSCSVGSPREEVAGGLWAFQIGRDSTRSSPPTRLDVADMPRDDGNHGPCFMTHGLFLSNVTDRLYTVTHWGAHSSVEVFKVDYRRSDEDDPSSPGQQTLPPFSLTWIRSVRSDTFPNFGINDVVEGIDASELYVTQWLPFGLPVHGRKNPSTLMEKIQRVLLLPLFGTGLKLSYVQRCTFDPDDPAVPPRCADATLGGPSKQFRLRVANGIAVNNDRTEVFVCDSMAYSIVTFRRGSETGALEATGRIKLDHACDNIEWKRDGDKEEIWMGIVPDMVSAAWNQEMASSFEEHTSVSGGLAVVGRRRGAAEDWSGQRVVYNHDGSMLSQVSFGMIHDGKVILGSPSAPGILVCDA